MRSLCAGALGRPRGAGKLSQGGQATAPRVAGWRGGLAESRTRGGPEPASQRGRREIIGVDVLLVLFSLNSWPAVSLAEPGLPAAALREVHRSLLVLRKLDST